MGLKHPISLKLKQYLNWNSIIYKFDSKNLSEIYYKEILLSAVLQHYFQSLLISKPIFNHYIKELSIIIYLYSKKKPLYYKKYKFKQTSNKCEKKNLKKKFFFSTGFSPINPAGRSTSLAVTNRVKKKMVPWEINRLKKLETIMTIIYGNKVKLKLIKLKNPILNSSILAQYISINIMRYNINVLWRKILKKFKLLNFKNHNTTIAFNWKNLVVHGYSFLYNKFYSYITGIKLRTSGKFSRRKGAFRTKIKNYSIGYFKFNSESSLIDYGFIEKKSKNGSQSIKVFTTTYISYLI